MWGLRPDEAVGEHLLNLEIGLPTAELRPLVRRTLAGDSAALEIHIPAINRRGRQVKVRVVCTALLADGQSTGAILLMEPDEGTAG
jgi:two-component system CheB/CheR fusion protein